MSLQPQPKPSDLVKVLERENVISYKKKPKVTKQLMKSHNNEDQDNVSAQSLQSGVYSQDVIRLKGKMNPLPQLGKQKRRFITKNLLTQQLRINNYQEKQVRQHDNLMLKQKNNFLSSENMKLKTKISTLQKQNMKLQKTMDEQSIKPKTPGLANLTKQRFRGVQNLSTKMLMKSLKKQLQDIKKQNTNIKSSIKFTTISQLQCQRDAIMQQTQRLRLIIDQQQSKRINMKINYQGMSNMEQKINSLNQKNIVLNRENVQLNNRIKRMEESQAKFGKVGESQKNLNKMLYNARRLLKQKEKEVQTLKQQIKSQVSIQNIALLSEKSLHNVGANQQRKPSLERPGPSSRNFDRRIISKSAQKMKPLQKQKGQACQNCKKLSNQIEVLQKKLSQLQSQLMSSNPLSLPSQPIAVPSSQQISLLSRFISYRFKAHHLSLSQSQKYLLNTQNITQQELAKEITIEQFMESLVSQPFVILNKRYIEVFLTVVFYHDQTKHKTKINVDKNRKLTKKKIIQNYKKIITPFQLMPQPKQEEMFLQIAELVTSYYQHILAALNNRKNGDGTVTQKDLVAFFTQIQLEKDYIDFIITQIILESIDLQRLNYFAFFQIFYMPQQQAPAAQSQKIVNSLSIDKKKRFQVDHVVKQQDEQYQQSRSYVDARQKTLSKKEESFNDSKNIYDEDAEDLMANDQADHPPQHTNQDYAQEEQYQDQYQQRQNEKPNKKQKEIQPKINQKPKVTVEKPVKLTIEKQQTTKDKKMGDKVTKQTIKKQASKKSYDQQGFEQQKMNSQQAEQQPSKKSHQVLVEIQIQNIQDQYEQQFQS